MTNGVLAFDFHGYSGRDRLLDHHRRAWSSQYKASDPGWGCTLERVEFDLLNRRDLNTRHMRGPEQYLRNAIPRARCFIDRIDYAKAAEKALQCLKLSNY